MHENQDSVKPSTTSKWSSPNGALLWACQQHMAHACITSHLFTPLHSLWTVSFLRASSVHAHRQRPANSRHPINTFYIQPKWLCFLVAHDVYSDAQNNPGCLTKLSETSLYPHTSLSPHKTGQGRQYCPLLGRRDSGGSHNPDGICS